MRLHEKPLGFVINFLLGIAWASVFIGVVTSFTTFYPFGIFDAIMAAIIGIIPGLVVVLLLEHIITAKEKHYELQKQTLLLEKLLEKFDTK